MTSETDYPRQRTVAELLAEHGGVQTGRRRRRRAEDEGGDAVDVASAVSEVDLPVDADRTQLFAGPDRSILRDPVPDDPTIGVASRWDSMATQPAVDVPRFGAPIDPARSPGPADDGG